eukprot:11208473-Lingulodinium_polyedra.AAC.1
MMGATQVFLRDGAARHRARSVERAVRSRPAWDPTGWIGKALSTRRRYASTPPVDLFGLPFGSKVLVFGGPVALET